MEFNSGFKGLTHTHTNTTLPLNNSTGHSFSTHRPTRYTRHALSDMYADIHLVIYQQFHRTRSLWITYTESDFYVLLTVYLGIILVNNQLDAQFFFVYVYFYPPHVSGSHVPIIRRNVSIHPVYVTLYR